MSTREDIEAAFDRSVAATWHLSGMRTGGWAAVREATVAYGLGGTSAALAAVVARYASPSMTGPLTQDCMLTALPFREEGP